MTAASVKSETGSVTSLAMFQAVKWNAGGSENSDQEPENCVSQPVLVGPSGGWVLGVVRGWKILEGRLASNNHNPDSDKFR